MDYYSIRPYRKKRRDDEEKRLNGLMEERFRQGFGSYWEQFGYEVGGPVCFAYVRWLADVIEKKHPEVTDIAFIARDGWLLKRIYERLFPDTEIRTHYVYAPRAMKKACGDTDEYEEYKSYIRGIGFGKGTIAAVDTVTMGFSGQGMISEIIENPVYGFYWVVLRGYAVAEKMYYEAFQKEGYHRIRCWNLMEYIMTSPEAPIERIAEGKPIYGRGNSYEPRRQDEFMLMEKGVMDFVDNVCNRFVVLPLFSEQTVRVWVNEFLKHPSGEDIRAFSPVRFSETANHTDDVPLDPFVKEGLSLYRKLWAFSLRYPPLYRILHKGKQMYTKKIGKEIRG